MNRRIALLLAAVIVAAIGTSLVFFYVRTADTRAIADQKPVTVLVAKVPIAAGTRVLDAANQGAFEPRTFPASAVAPGALSAVEPVREFVSLAPIFPGQQLLTGMFGATAAANNTLPIPPGQIAISFQFGDPQRVAGFVKPGSNVVIFLTSALAGGGQAPDATRVLLPKATVIAAGPTTVTPPSDPTQANPEAVPRALLTLALTQRDAEKLVYASTKGTMYLGLLSDKSTIQPNAGVNATNLFT